MKQKLDLPPAPPPPAADRDDESNEEEDSDALDYDSDTGEIAEKRPTGSKEAPDSDSDSDEDENNDGGDTLGGGTLKLSRHKRDMEKLKASDPEFYKYLESADKELLDFEASDEEGLDVTDEESDGEDDKEDEEKAGVDDEEKIHQPPDKLEVASDESDAEEAPTKEAKERAKKTKGGVKVTQKMVSDWSRKIREEASLGSLKRLVGAFRCAVQQCGAKEEEKVKQSAFIVEGSAVFNAVVRACLVEIRPALHSILKLPSEKTMEKKDMIPSESSFWMRVHNDVKLYLTSLIQLLQVMAESSIVGVVLKHIHQMVPYVVCFPKVARAAMRRLVKLWSQEEETVRVLAFLSILKTVHRLQDKLLDIVVKSMYVAFVRNTKFTSPSTLPLINFMQHSLVELLLLNPVVAYQHAFVYIRQLAIHLRNAITVHKKETVQTVYNWQFIHSLHLWCRMLAAAGPNNATLQPLIYPLTQVAFGVMKLNPSVKFLPLRFHCIRALNILGEATNTYIPLLSPTVEVFSLVNFTKPFPSNSLKPLNFACMLKLSKKQLRERSLQDGAMDQIYDMIVEHLGSLSHSISFPELVIPTVIRMKKFSKTTSASRFIKLVKQMLTLIQENASFIEAKRKSATFGIGDLNAVDRWEADLKEAGTPLKKYLDEYKVKRIEELRLADASRDQQREEMKGDESKKRKMVEKKGKGAKRKREADEDDDDDDDDDDDEDMVDLTEEDFANAASDSEGGEEEEEDGNDEEKEDEEDNVDEDEFKEKLSSKKLSKTELKKLKARKDVVEDFDLGESDDDGKGQVDDDDEDDDGDSEEDD